MPRRALIPVLAMFVVVSMVAATAQRTFADPRDFRLTNTSVSSSVMELWVDVAGPGDFSTELLGGSQMAPGESGTVTFNSVDAGKCIYDFLAVFSDGHQAQFNNLDLCSTASVSVG